MNNSWEAAVDDGHEHNWKPDAIGIDIRAGSAERFVWRCGLCGLIEESNSG